MEDSQLDFDDGEGPGARSIKLDCRVHAVGATNRAGLLTCRWRDRFRHRQTAWNSIPPRKFNQDRHPQRIDSEAALQPDGAGSHRGAFARHTGASPTALLRRVRTFAEVKAGGLISGEVALAAARYAGSRSSGFRHAGRENCWLTVIEKFRRRTRGLDSLAAR